MRPSASGAGFRNKVCKGVAPPAETPDHARRDWHRSWINGSCSAEGMNSTAVICNGWPFTTDAVASTAASKKNPATRFNNGSCISLVVADFSRGIFQSGQSVPTA